jgi:heat shock protein HslJ
VLMKRTTASLALPLLAGATLLAGCAGYAGADPAAPSKSATPSVTFSKAPAKPGSLVGAQWRLKSDPTAWFRVQGSNISGNDSCNSLTGTATALSTSADRVDFGQGVAATMMYCADPKGTQTAIREALTGLRVWNRNGSELVLTDAANSRSWTFVLTGSAAPSATAAPSAAAARSATSAPSAR